MSQKRTEGSLLGNLYDSGLSFVTSIWTEAQGILNPLTKSPWPSKQGLCRPGFTVTSMSILRGLSGEPVGVCF